MAAVDGFLVSLPVAAEGYAIAPRPGAVSPLPTIYIKEYGYRMRAFDETLGEDVYWTTIFIDSSGTEYTGPGPLTDIIVSHVIGT